MDPSDVTLLWDYFDVILETQSLLNILHFSSSLLYQKSSIPPVKTNAGFNLDSCIFQMFGIYKEEGKDGGYNVYCHCFWGLHPHAGQTQEN